MFKKDSVKLGIILGLLSPVIGITGFYLLKFRSASFIDFLRVLAAEKNILTSAVTFSLFVNAVFFTIYINSQKDNTAKGIFGVTVIWAITAIILKFVY